MPVMLQVAMPVMLHAAGWDHQHTCQFENEKVSIWQHKVSGCLLSHTPPSPCGWGGSMQNVRAQHGEIQSTNSLIPDSHPISPNNN